MDSTEQQSQGFAREAGRELFDEAALPTDYTPINRLEWIVVREMTDDDVLNAMDSVEVIGPTSLANIRYAHHRLAQLICEGTAPVKISMLTGYSPAYIGRLQGDPTFRELLAYYSAQTETVFADTIEQLKTLGLSAIGELQARFESDPEKWSKRELMDLAKLAAVDPIMAASKSGNGFASGPAVAVNVQFVTAPPPEGLPPATPGTVEIIPPEQEI